MVQLLRPEERSELQFETVESARSRVLAGLGVSQRLIRYRSQMGAVGTSYSRHCGPGVLLFLMDSIREARCDRMRDR